MARKIQSEKTAGPDLSTIGDKHDAAWITKWCMREVEKEGKTHKSEYKGTKEDLQAIANWLATLNPVVRVRLRRYPSWRIFTAKRHQRRQDQNQRAGEPRRLDCSSPRARSPRVAALAACSVAAANFAAQLASLLERVAVEECLGRDLRVDRARDLVLGFVHRDAAAASAQD